MAITVAGLSKMINLLNIKGALIGIGIASVIAFGSGWYVHKIKAEANSVRVEQAELFLVFNSLTVPVKYHGYGVEQ